MSAEVFINLNYENDLDLVSLDNIFKNFKKEGKGIIFILIKVQLDDKFTKFLKEKMYIHEWTGTIHKWHNLSDKNIEIEGYMYKIIL